VRRFPFNLRFGEATVVRLPRVDVYGSRLNDRIENVRDASRVRAGIDFLTWSNDSRVELVRKISKVHRPENHRGDTRHNHSRRQHLRLQAKELITHRGQN
jgi:hypothetical protein